MLNITDNLTDLIDQSEHKYNFDKEINIGGKEYYLSGSIEFVLHTVVSKETRDLPASIESQYCLNIIDDLELWIDGGHSTIDFWYDEKELMEVFEIS